MQDVHEEQVLVVPTRLFRELGYFQGFKYFQGELGDASGYLAALTDPANVSYRPRREMEQDPSFKQLIPYVLFRHIDELGQESLFQYTRGAGQGEKRLHAKRSVGIGGHISSTDSEAASGDTYREGMLRELSEEVSIDSIYSEQCLGLINDDETEVGRVHLGVVHIYDMERPAVASRETDILESGFRPIRELLENLDGFETWSKICLRALFAN
jgi:predicted NUDIX family phosphoesterase